MTSTALAIETKPLGLNAKRVIAQRYAVKNDRGEPTEDWEQIVERVVRHVAQAERDTHAREEFYERMIAVMLPRKFVPNTPCLVNAGRADAQLAACFVLEVPDSISGIMEHAQKTAIIHKTGGGVGMSYELIRPAGARVRSTRGVASGPVSFMQIVDATTNAVKQGGVRRGANMGILSVTHPDVLRFIHSKNNQNALTNFNISVTVTDAFMEAVEKGSWFQLEFDGAPWNQPIYDPVTEKDYVLYRRPDNAPITFRDRSSYLSFIDTDENGSKIEEPPRPGMVYAPDVWNRIVASAHKYAEPGVIFIDEVNRKNLLMNSMGPIRSCNPCGEEMLHANNACNLGSIDVSKFYETDRGLRWDLLREAVQLSVRFLDNVIDTCAWPLPEIEDVVKRTRPIGLGIMGYADLCLQLKITYGSRESVELVDQVMKFVTEHAWRTSLQLGSERGTFQEFEANREAYTNFFRNKIGITDTTPLTPRNYEVTTCAPTGTISLVAECSSGIEPNFSWAYVRQDTLGTRTYVHTLAAQALGIDVDQTNQDSINRAAAYVVEHEAELPPYFISAMKISAEQHVQVLAATQRNVDNSVSKTCNGAETDTVEDVDRLYRLARQLGCKAVSYYRDGSRDGQVLTSIKQEIAEEETSASEVTTSTIQRDDDKQEETRAPRIERPRVLTGSTINLNFDGQNLFVTVNYDEKRKIREVFAIGPISGGVGLLASKMLRGGFEPDEVANCLNKVTGTHAVWFNERCLTSPEQAVAECIRITLRQLKSEDDSNHPPTGIHAPTKELRQVVSASAIHANGNSSNNGNGTHPGNTSGQRVVQLAPAGYCPQCHDPLIPNGKCPYCRNCSFSRCG